jgi:hypothetical protein
MKHFGPKPHKIPFLPAIPALAKTLVKLARKKGLSQTFYVLLLKKLATNACNKGSQAQFLP